MIQHPASAAAYRRRCFCGGGFVGTA